MKEVSILPNCPEDAGFLIGESHVKVGNLTVEQAELIASQYPGQYVSVVEKKSEAAAPKPLDAPAK